MFTPHLRRAQRMKHADSGLSPWSFVRLKPSTLSGVVLTSGQGKSDTQQLVSPPRALASFPLAAGTTCKAAAIARTIHGTRWSSC